MRLRPDRRHVVGGDGTSSPVVISDDGESIMVVTWLVVDDDDAGDAAECSCSNASVEILMAGFLPDRLEAKVIVFVVNRSTKGKERW